MRDVTVIITTFFRPECLIRCVRSIRMFYPEIEIIVSDNGKPDDELNRELIRGYKCKYLLQPFDSGASYAKNAALDETKTKYAVIIDNDFEFNVNSKLEKFKAILDANEDIGVVGGKPHTPKGKPGTRGSRILINKEEAIFWRFPIEKPEWKSHEGIKYYYADYTRQFLMIRNVSDIRWDSDMKIGGLHIAFFINIKLNTSWKVAYVPEVKVIHHHASFDPAYMAYRRRRNFRKVFHKKMGLRYGIFHDHTIIDYKHAAKMKPPDFERFNNFRPEE